MPCGTKPVRERSFANVNQPETEAFAEVAVESATTAAATKSLSTARMVARGRAAWWSRFDLCAQ